MASCSPRVLVGGAGCALLGGLELKLNLTVLGIGVDWVNFFHSVKHGGWIEWKFFTLSLVACALSQSRLYRNVMLDAPSFRPLETSRDLEFET